MVFYGLELFASTYPIQVSSQGALTKPAVSVSIKDSAKKGTVVVFLPAKFPCSDSHIVDLIKNPQGPAGDNLSWDRKDLYSS